MKRLIISLVVLIGLIFVAVGIVYFVVKAGSLPSFFPGHLKGSTKHHDKRGLFAVVIGVVLLVAPWVGSALSKRYN
jgi:hypothetical protein